MFSGQSNQLLLIIRGRWCKKGVIAGGRSAQNFCAGCKHKSCGVIEGNNFLFFPKMTVDYASRLLFKVAPVDKSKTKCLSHALLLANSLIHQTGSYFITYSIYVIVFRKRNFCIFAAWTASCGQTSTVD